MSVPGDTERTACIRARLGAGTLPTSAENQKVYAGYGERQPCDCCGRSIDGTEVMYEVELASPRVRPLAMHLKCFDAWMAESRSRLRPRPGPDPGPGSGPGGSDPGVRTMMHPARVAWRDPTC